ncbi:MAG: hypothetical protein Q8P81_03275 [Nanoarchaeota archaeon]|nr:hypothetical protein [Nanoarchaeota archaeon]
MIGRRKGDSDDEGKSSFCSHSPKLDIILERMDHQDKEISEIKDNVKEVTRLVSDPEKGVYSRVKFLEVSKRNNSKVFWIIFSATVSLVVSSVLWWAKIR